MDPGETVPPFPWAKVRRGILRFLPWAFLWAAFCGFGVYLRAQIPWDDCLFELHGLDYGIHGYKLSHYHWIGQLNFRHPLFPFLMSPVILFGQRLLNLGNWPYWGFLCLVFSGVMTGATALVHGLVRRVPGADGWTAAGAAALFASFSYTWFLAACPESFPIACAALLLLPWWATHPQIRNPKVRKWGWIALAFLNGGITLTHAVKAALAYLADRGFAWKRIGRLSLVGAAVLLCGAGVILVRYALARWLGGVDKTNISDGIVYSLSSFSAFVDVRTAAHWLAHFFSEPIVTHGDSLSANHLTRSYSCVWASVSVAALYALAVWGCWRGRRLRLTRILLAMFAVDFALHILLLWGLEEGHIYCGHWFFLPAILAAILPTTFKGRARRFLTVFLFLLALVLFLLGAGHFSSSLSTP